MSDLDLVGGIDLDFISAVASIVFGTAILLLNQRYTDSIRRFQAPLRRWLRLHQPRWADRAVVLIVGAGFVTLGIIWLLSG